MGKGGAREEQRVKVAGLVDTRGRESAVGRERAQLHPHEGRVTEASPSHQSYPVRVRSHAQVCCAHRGRCLGELGAASHNHPRTGKCEEERRHDRLDEGIHVEVEGGLKDNWWQEPDHEELQAAWGKRGRV